MEREGEDVRWRVNKTYLYSRNKMFDPGFKSLDVSSRSNTNTTCSNPVSMHVYWLQTWTLRNSESMVWFANLSLTLNWQVMSAPSYLTTMRMISTRLTSWVLQTIVEYERKCSLNTAAFPAQRADFMREFRTLRICIITSLELAKINTEPVNIQEAKNCE